MTISPVGGTAAQSALSQLYTVQQAQAASAVSVDSPVGDGWDASAPTASTSANNLTGSATASLDSQTLQALLGLTQETDPSSQAGGQASTVQQGGGHHHHHHHGGGGMQAPSQAQPGTSPFSTAMTSSPSDPTASAIADSEDSTDASLESALLAA